MLTASMLTKSQINFLDNVCPDRWIEHNGVIDVKGNVSMLEINLTKIPVQFGRVDGDFECNVNKLTTLHGSPSIIAYNFSCEYNSLITLEGGPKEVGGYYSCMGNKLHNLIGAPEICNNSFYCSDNPLTSLEGCPRSINGDLWCTDNLSILMYGIGTLYKNIYYNNRNDLNAWIIEQAKNGIFATYANIADWIKDNNRLEFLLNALPEIRQLFSSCTTFSRYGYILI